MSVMAAVARTRALSNNQAVRVARRNLGETVVGPSITNIPANFKIAVNMFTKRGSSYGEYKQQCVSLRIFAFVGVTGYCALKLVLDPPKSSYWKRMSPYYAFANTKALFVGSPPPMFPTAKVEHEADVPGIVKQLTTTRRLASAGSDSEDE